MPYCCVAWHNVSIGKGIKVRERNYGNVVCMEIKDNVGKLREGEICGLKTCKYVDCGNTVMSELPVIV